MVRRRGRKLGQDPAYETDYNSTDVILTEVSRLQSSSAVLESVSVEPTERESRGTSLEESDDPAEPVTFEISEEDGEERVRVKTRAYDFILPYHVTGWKPYVFIQSQFYAGDSGSVSHKNVDQTSTSRGAVLANMGSPRFVEYVDGAGYFSSLNGDLRKLLNMPTTTSFFQIRSAAIRLRRELQQIGFLLPIEIEHAVFRTDGSQAKIRKLLTKEGYSPNEINRCLAKCVENGLLLVENGRITIVPARRDAARRYFLMDVAAVHGSPPASPGDRLSGSLMVPGYGPFHGTKLDELAAHALRLASSLKTDWSDPTVIMGDVRWLCDQGMAMSN